jgi:hypothetical protein
MVFCGNDLGRPKFQLDFHMQSGILLSRFPSRYMSKQLLVRDVPDRVRSWIENERTTLQMSQQEFLVSVLEQVCDKTESQLPLFPPAYKSPKRT